MTEGQYQALHDEIEEVLYDELGVSFGTWVGGATEAVMPIVARELATRDAVIADYENRINWNTTCQQCATVLDRSIQDYERAERAEAVIEQIRALHRKSTLPVSTGPDRGKDFCLYCTMSNQVDDVVSYVLWPCNTVRILSSLPSAGDTQ